MPLPAVAKGIAAAARKASGAIGAARSAAGAIEGATGGKAEGSAQAASPAGSEAAPAKDTKEDMRERKEAKDGFREKVRGHLEAGEALSDEDLKELVSDAGLPDGVPADWDRCCESVDLMSGKILLDVDGAILEQLANHC